MSAILTSRQAEELYVASIYFFLNNVSLIPGSNKAIVAYLTVSNLPESANALRQEVKLGNNFDDATRKKYEGLLEKKWTSVVRLQKKV